MSTDTYTLVCPFCDKHYTLPREKVIKNAGKSIHCRECKRLFVVTVPEIDEPPAEAVIPASESPHQKEEPLQKEAAIPEKSFAESAIQMPASGPDSFEPPPFSEYAGSPEAEPIDEPAPEAENEQTRAISVESSEVPNTLPSAESIDEPPAHDETDHFPSEAATHGSDSGMEEKPSIETPDWDTSAIEAPPPQLPPVPVSAPFPPFLPKPRRGARSSVTPVFVPEEEEPQPRRRRLGGRTEPVDPIQVAMTPDPKTPEPEPFAPVPESPMPQTPEMDVVLQETLTQVELDQEIKPSADVEAGNDDDAEEMPLRAGALLGGNVRSPAKTMPAQPMSLQSIEDLSAIRGSMGLLKAMSVIIAVLLLTIVVLLLDLALKK